MRLALTATIALLASVASLPAMAKKPSDAAPAQRTPPGNCTTDNLVHGEVSAAITRHVADSIKLMAKDARLRDAAKLTLPCGFAVDGRWTANLFLTNGTETRRYFENNPFGFSLPYGPGDQAGGSFVLKYETVDAKTLASMSCPPALQKYLAGFALCASFGSDRSFFGVRQQGGHWLLAHYAVDPAAGMTQDFAVADSAMQIKTIFFIPPPDAPGGTITLILDDRGDLYRAFIDVSRG